MMDDKTYILWQKAEVLSDICKSKYGDIPFYRQILKKIGSKPLFQDEVAAIEGDWSTMLSPRLRKKENDRINRSLTMRKNPS